MFPRRKNRKTLRNASAPRPEFAQALWVKLDAEIASTATPRKAAWSRLFVVPVAALALFAMTGVGAYAYASPNVTEGTSLYPVKRELERFELSMYRDPEARAHFYARMLRRRVKEARVRESRGDMTREELIEVVRELNIRAQDVLEPHIDGDVIIDLPSDVAEDTLEDSLEIPIEAIIRNKNERDGVEGGTIDIIDPLIP